MKNLKSDVYRFLADKGSEGGSFFVDENNMSLVMGSVEGRFVCLLIIEEDRKLNKSELQFIDGIKFSGGLAFPVRDVESLSELFKKRGWYDV